MREPLEFDWLLDALGMLPFEEEINRGLWTRKPILDNGTRSVEPAATDPTLDDFLDRPISEVGEPDVK